MAGGLDFHGMKDALQLEDQIDLVAGRTFIVGELVGRQQSQFAPLFKLGQNEVLELLALAEAGIEAE